MYTFGIYISPFRRPLEEKKKKSSDFSYIISWIGFIIAGLIPRENKREITSFWYSSEAALERVKQMKCCGLLNA